MLFPLSALLLSSLPLLSQASQATFSAPQVYLHPSPSSSHSSPPALTHDQAKAVLAHHLGHSSEFNLVETIGDWASLMLNKAVAFGEEDKQEDRARVLVIQGVEDPSDFTDLSPSFTLPSDKQSLSALLSPYLSQASAFFSHAMSSLAESKFFLDIFDLKDSEASHVLKDELSALAAWVEGLIPASFSSDAPYEVMAVDGLDAFQRGSEEYDSASDLVGVAVDQMSSSQTPFVLIITPPTSKNAPVRRARSKPSATTVLPPPKSTASPPSTPNKNASLYPGPVFSTNLCLDSYDACTNYTDGCSGRGTCGETKRGGKSCWTCSCITESTKHGRTSWTGVSCEKQDVSESFILIVFTVLLGFFLTVGSIMLLYSVGTIPLPSVLSSGAAPVGKRD